ncbi:uncharacterized protein [Rutidosis leptorrhynchoides]|uniref:uncharacterized protein n=1 Tax=Rutidosis leptorrhynchoides TaxID=125765 RepID=UPI003A98D3E7
MITHPESSSLVTRDLLGDHRSSEQQLLPDLKDSSDHHTTSKHQNLNKPPLNIFDDINLDLKLVPLSSSSSSSSSSSLSSPPYTLGKVKFALERAQKDYTKKRCISTPKLTFQETTKVEEEIYAAGCPSCLLYVLIPKTNPKCPRCNMVVPFPTTMKKPRTDLNFTI